VSEGPFRDVAYRSCPAAELAGFVPFVARVFEEEFDVSPGDAIAHEAETAAALFDARRDLLVAAEHAGRTVGVLLVVPGRTEAEAADFRWLAVDGTARGSGIGRELLFRGIEACRQRGRRILRAHAFAVSPAACRLYWLSGFRVAGLETYAVGTGMREHIVFEKELEPGVP
jgi:GNAT superfamily N-acetyltransferase